MRCASVLLLLAVQAFAGGINSDSALAAGQGQVVTRTKLRFADMEAEIEHYLAQQTALYGVTHKLSVIGTLGYALSSPGPDGLTDLLLRGRFRFYARDEKRATLSFAGILGIEIPVGETPIGSPEGGVLAGLVGTWERHGWRVDADLKRIFRPAAGDATMADVALVRNISESDEALWQAVLELNFRRTGNSDVLFLAPGLVYEMPGWKLELSIQIAVAEDASGPTPEYAVVFSVVHVF